MAKKDLSHKLVVTGIAANTAIDLKGTEGNLIAATLASAGDVTITITESDDNVTYTAVDDCNIIGVAAQTGVTAMQVSYVGDCRYIKITCTNDDAKLVRVAGHLHHDVIDA